MQGMWEVFVFQHSRQGDEEKQTKLLGQSIHFLANPWHPSSLTFGERMGTACISLHLCFCRLGVNGSLLQVVLSHSTLPTGLL